MLDGDYKVGMTANLSDRLDTAVTGLWHLETRRLDGDGCRADGNLLGMTSRGRRNFLPQVAIPDVLRSFYLNSNQVLLRRLESISRIVSSNAICLEACPVCPVLS